MVQADHADAGDHQGGAEQPGAVAAVLGVEAGQGICAAETPVSPIKKPPLQGRLTDRFRLWRSAQAELAENALAG